MHTHTHKHTHTHIYIYIYILPKFLKMYEQLFKKILLCLINKYNILNENQFGFR